MRVGHGSMTDFTIAGWVVVRVVGGLGKSP